jgi:preprotein translocase subunit SecD
MARQQGWFALILALAIAAGALLFSWNTPETPLGQRLGLDLRGGSQLTLQVLPAGAIKTVQKEQLDAVKEVLDRRINGLGVAESTLQTVGDDQLVLQLPGEQDPSRAAKVLGTTALLEFRAQKPGTEQRMQELLSLKRQATALLIRLNGPVNEATDNQQDVTTSPDAKQADRDQLEADLQRINIDIVAQFEPAGLSGKDLVTAGRQQQQTGTGWDVTLGFTKDGGDKFASLTQSSRQRALLEAQQVSRVISRPSRLGIWRFSSEAAPYPCQ